MRSSSCPRLALISLTASLALGMFGRPAAAEEPRGERKVEELRAGAADRVDRARETRPRAGDRPLTEMLRERQATRAERLTPERTERPSRGARRFVRVERTASELVDQAADPHLDAVLRHSETNGHVALVSDLHWGFGGEIVNGRRTPGGALQPNEDFRRGDAFVRFADQLGAEAERGERNVTLAMVGDWLELIEHLDPTASDAEVRGVITDIVEGHADEARALVRAIGHGVRIAYTVGNHDPFLADPAIRQHLVDELTRVGSDQARLDDVAASVRDAVRARVAFAGWAIPFGKRGELLATHGNAPDVTNRPRFLVSPKTRYGWENNLGWQIVRTLYSPAEKLDPTIDNEKGSGLQGIALRLLGSGTNRVSLGRLVWQLLAGTPHMSGSEIADEARDADAVTDAWVERSGFAARMAAGGSERTTVEWRDTLRQVLDGELPAAVHTRIPTQSRLANSIWIAANAGKIAHEVPAAERALAGLLTGFLPSVDHVVWGHDHRPGSVSGEVVAADGSTRPVDHWNTGSWTQVDGEWLLTVLDVTTDRVGKVSVNGLARVDPATGKPLNAERRAPKYDRIPGWVIERKR